MSIKLTLKEISQLADVSISTVSRVLSDSSYVKSTTRDKVLTVLNSAENNKNSNKLIAFIFPDISNLFFPLLFKGMKSISKMQGYNILISNTENSYETEVEILEDMLKCGVEGIIYIGDYAKKSVIQDILAKGEIPFVFLDRDPDIPNANLVTSNSVEGMYQSGKYIMDLGHKKILYLGGIESLPVEQQRMSGFYKAQKEHKISDKGIVKKFANYLMDDAYMIIYDMIQKGIFDFTAICASNDLMAFGAYKALNDNGLSVPNDVSLIGYDDIPMSLVLNLTTVRQPFEEMGRNAMIALSNKIVRQTQQPVRSVLDAGLVIRSTCKVLH